jgi:hypothetical protein
MKGFNEFYSNVVVINEKEIVFKYPILSIYVNKDRIYVLVYAHENERIKIIPKDDLNNVFCYDDNANFLWQIKAPHFKEFPKYEQYIISVVKIIGDKLYAFDWMGRCFDVNQENGELMSFTTTK